MKQGKINLVTLIVLILNFVPLVGSDNNEILSPWIMSHVETAAAEFLSANLEDIRFKPLTGGHSNAVNVLLEVDNKTYVLRVNSELEASLKRNTELYAMKLAAASGIAPTIHWVTPDGYGILMDYISGGTLSIKESREPKIIIKIADLLRKTHAIPKNPFFAPSFERQMEDYANEHARRDNHQAIWIEAISIIKKGAIQLTKLNSPSVSTHGDLNPRNILVSGHDVYFIDWGDGMYCDPFLDLAFISISLDYGINDDTYLLQCYLEHAPTLDEQKRFLIAKRMNFARLALAGQGIGNQLSEEGKNEEAGTEQSKEWSYYANVFASGSESLSAQFFWGLAQTALESAKAIDVDF